MITTNRDRREARIEAIRQGAIVRSALGQAAIHRRFPDGRHEVIVRGQVHVGASLYLAIDIAREEAEPC